MLRLSYVGYIYIYNYYIFFLDCSLDHYVVSSYNSLYFKVYVMCYKYCYSHFLVASIYMKYLFPGPQFQSNMSFGLRWISCRQHIYRSYFCTHLASLWLFVGTFNPFTFKVIIEKYDPIAIYYCFGFFFYKPLPCFLSREEPLAFVEELVWWYWILLAFACL